MIRIDLSGCRQFVDDSTFDIYKQKALEAQKTLRDGTGAGNAFLGWLTLPDEVSGSFFEECDSVSASWAAKRVDLIVVIAIGGSYLGGRCAIKSLSKNFDRHLNYPHVIFAGNTLSEDYMADVLEAASVRNVACIVISKSGTTTESAVTFRIFKKFLEDRYGRREAASRIIAVTDASKGALRTLATKEGYRTFVVPDNIGGRFSVLTPVGMLPVALAGFDIRAIIEGAAMMKEELFKEEYNAAVQYAAMRNALHGAYGKSVELLVGYNPKLQFLGEWWKQLFGESEGKDGKGLFPAAVSYSTDLHSIGQYIQDGMRIMFETVLSIEDENRGVFIEEDPDNLDQLNYLAGKSVDHCNNMARLGTREAHIDGGVPQIAMFVEKLDEKGLGALFYFFEYACGVSAYTLGVNPFDQPGVEDYKKHMFKLLGKPGYDK